MAVLCSWMYKSYRTDGTDYNFGNTCFFSPRQYACLGIFEWYGNWEPMRIIVILLCTNLLVLMLYWLWSALWRIVSFCVYDYTYIEINIQIVQRIQSSSNACYHRGPIPHKCQNWFLQNCIIKGIQQGCDPTSSNTMQINLSVFLFFHLDLCNALLTGLLTTTMKKLQQQNSEWILTRIGNTRSYYTSFSTGYHPLAPCIDSNWLYCWLYYYIVLYCTFYYWFLNLWFSTPNHVISHKNIHPSSKNIFLHLSLFILLTFADILPWY